MSPSWKLVGPEWLLVGGTLRVKIDSIGISTAWCDIHPGREIMDQIRFGAQPRYPNGMLKLTAGAQP